MIYVQNVLYISGGESGLSDDCDNESLYAPPPAYEEVINSNMYPATPEERRVGIFPIIFFSNQITF